jgi:hypothetical protein
MTGLIQAVQRLPAKTRVVALTPPRDLRSWQEYPISAIANFSPTSVENGGRQQMRETFEMTSFERVPIVDQVTDI